jgi:proprotein convertase subtilisin/kexin type 5
MWLVNVTGNLSCYKCNSTCATCNITENNCTSCSSPYFLNNDTCVSTCDPGYYNNPNNQICTKCAVGNCSECSGPNSGNCTKCFTFTNGTKLYLSPDALSANN